MKNKLLAVLCCLLFISQFLYSSANQKLYDANDDEYRKTVILCISSGVIGPSSATPVTGEELLIALDRVRTENLNSELRAIFEETYSKVAGYDNSFSWEYNIDLTAQFFLTTDMLGKEGIIEDRRDFFLPYNEERPFLDLGVGFNFGSYVFVEGALPLLSGASPVGMNITSLDWIATYRNDGWITAWNQGPDLLSNIPVLARGSVGNKWINVIIGRTPHSMGSGFTGNLVISDNFLYQEVFDISLNSNFFSYDMSLTHFDTQTGLESFKKESFGGKHQTRIVHRFDFNIADKARIVLNFGSTYYADSAWDFRFFTPFMIAHNYYNNSNDLNIVNDYDEANNIGSIEIEWTIIPKLSVSMQAVMDQFLLPWETNGLPNALGLLANASWTETFGNSAARFWFEFLYTTPYLYLNEKYNVDENGNRTPNYNYDWILGYYRDSNRAPEINFSGHPFGPDTIAVAIGTNYDNYDGNYWIDGELIYKVQGEKGILNPTLDGGEGPYESTPSGIPAHTIELNAHAGWEFYDSLELFGGVSFAYHVNYKNHQDKNVFIPQMYLGLTYSPF